ncbi:hypothetical protein LWC33_33270 [Pseudonocardia sp. RS11V-5]|uniref:hypothetical protein n=1 Tax=Pseudonocardia terrae TaxID=2905831 RepID=UPI001E5159C2|nr:hypothetical protein [Pseudonocardia terrae]MCE3556301.1 hypothetical protein [Pseudonocardia terrae]
MGVLGELFPGPKISDEAGESGNGENFRLGPIDLENGVVQVVRAGGAEQAGTAVEGEPADAPADGDGD